MHFNGFRPVRTEHGTDLPEVQRWVIKNSKGLKEGSAVKVTPANGVEIADATGDSIYGYCVGFVDKSGIPLRNDASDYDGTLTESPSGDQYVAASDNESDKYIAALIVPAHGVVCSALLDADSGTTTRSDKVGTYFDIETTESNYATKVDESTASTTKANYQSVPGRSAYDPTDPADPESDRILVKAIEVQAFDNS